MSLLTRFVLPALAAAGTAVAASCSASATTIQNQGDATALAACKTFTGNVVIATGTTDQINIPTVQKIDGDFTVTNVSLITSIGADSLTEITGKFTLNEVQVLTSLNFPRLAAVDDIEWNALPNLQQLTFTTTVTKASTINIQNTELNSLEGIDLETVDTFYIANNRYLNDITLQLTQVGNALTLEANNPAVNVSFPNMIWANNMTFRNCSSISIPSLESINGSLGFYGNDIESFIGANLTTVGKDLSFVSNTKLANISLPLLKSVGGGFTVANNTDLGQVDGFTALQKVVGAVDFNGNFSDVALPGLKDVQGAFNIQSTGDLTKQCAHFSDLKDSSVIKGDYVCEGKVSNPGGAGTTPTSTAGGAKASKTGAAGRVEISSAVMGVSGLIAAFFGLL
ncbi:hypothetical protein BU16DRAFT_530349 [Lophium mytilinum]|uniref:GPI-anchored cell wall organization protein Ecm33 n=1 Tax=Lophium mytilinum TaxID=390894 RepID=A0A6A6QE90_9PEZI|nr:hypothetical protein BU16DRAFT_530349 [Lophium mytilinum]